jgi:hypothetical protein
MSVSCSLQNAPQLENLSILLRRGVAGVAILRCGGRGGEVIVVVLGVELQFGCTGGSHDGQMFRVCRMLWLENGVFGGEKSVFIVGAGVMNGG